MGFVQPSGRLKGGWLMQKKRIITFIVIILILLGVFGTAYSYLMKTQTDIIKIAFMNGYIEAYKLSDEEKQKMSHDEKYYKNKVSTAAEQYLKKVENLNRK